MDKSALCTKDEEEMDAVAEESFDDSDTSSTSLIQQAAKIAIVTFLQYDGLLAHQINSYEAFMLQQLRVIVMENSDLTVMSEKTGHCLQLSFVDVHIRSPQIQEADGVRHHVWPNECRLRGLSYNVSVYLDAVLKEEWRAPSMIPETPKTAAGSETKASSTAVGPPKEGGTTIYHEMLLCNLPCMVQSSLCTLRAVPPMPWRTAECYLDKGGYFIISGTEKCPIAQERLRNNYIFVRTVAGACVAEIRSAHNSKTRSTSTLQMQLTVRGKMTALLASLPFVDIPVPLCILLRLFNVPPGDLHTTILEQLPSANPKERQDVESLLYVALVTATPGVTVTQTREELVEWLGRTGTKEPTSVRRARYIDHILNSELLPHLGTDNTPKTHQLKVIFLSLMTIKILRVSLKQLMPDDRDDLALKRVDATGVLFATLFRQLYRNFLKLLQTNLHRVMEARRHLNLLDLVQNSSKITSGFAYAMATGQWGVQKSSSQKGVVQVRQPQNIMGGLSHLRRVNTPVAREGKLTKPRELSLSHYGRLCAVETPEGQACGLVEVLALLVHIRQGSPAVLLLQNLRRHLSLAPLAFRTPHDTMVLVNGMPLGLTQEPERVVVELRQRRRATHIPFDVSIVHLPREHLILVDNDAGCLLRPLIPKHDLGRFYHVTHTAPPPLLWRHLCAMGAVEFVDRLEEMHLAVSTLAGAQWATHVELHPSGILGLCASMIPLLNHNQAPRNLFQSAMSKQAMGLHTHALELQMPTLSHVLHYPQPHLVPTLTYLACDGAKAPSSVNVIVAICTYGGYNQEDSIIVNAAALQRGLFRSTVLRTFKDEDRASNGDQEVYGFATEGLGGSNEGNGAGNIRGQKCASYSKLDKDGLPRPRVLIDPNDVVICKRLVSGRSTGGGGDLKVVDHSMVYNHNERMTVDEVLVAAMPHGGRLVRVRLKALRIPEIGDKLSSLHAQKGVIGMIYPEADMPYTADGLIPDIIINPHAIPSRMTVAQLLEMLLGRVACCVGTTVDGTAFQDRDFVREAADILQAHGYHPQGNETLFSGFTGRPMIGTVFVGPCAYQRLKHVVADKAHARSRGPKQILTRQPCEGRSRQGGLRFGEMEKDAVCAHGAAHVLMDRLMEQSDQIEVPICERCGLLAERHVLPTTTAAPVPSRLWCRNCQTSDTVHLVHLPAAARLLMHELAGLHVAMRLRLNTPPAAGSGSSMAPPATKLTHGTSELDDMDFAFPDPLPLADESNLEEGEDPNEDLGSIDEDGDVLDQEEDDGTATVLLDEESLPLPSDDFSLSDLPAECDDEY